MEGIATTLQVGKTAPGFELNAYVRGDFKTVSLAEYKGQWVGILFYPADFTFV